LSVLSVVVSVALFLSVVVNWFVTYFLY
jgi:hypothetical protein